MTGGIMLRGIRAAVGALLCGGWLAATRPVVRAATRQIGEKAQSIVTIEEGAGPEAETRIHRVNRRFDTVQRSKPPGILVLQETIDIEESVAHGYLKTLVTLDATMFSKGRRWPLFSIKAQGSRAALFQGETLYIVTDLGCCGGRDTHSVFSLKNGRRLFVTGGQSEPLLMTLQVGATGQMYHVGLHSSGTAQDRLIYGAAKPDEADALLVTLASDDEPLQSVVVTLDRHPSRRALSPVARWVKQGTAQDRNWLQARKDESVLLEVVMSPAEVIRIPVREGRMGSLHLPSGMKARPMELGGRDL